MKKIKLLTVSVVILLGSFVANGQEFNVEKITGKVLVMQDMQEDYREVKVGQKLSGSDLIITNENSLIQLSKDGNRFLLKGNSALGLNYIKEVSINDLLLALTMEEIRNLPKDKLNGAKSTAVYGTKESNKISGKVGENELGYKKINGARQLAESGYEESAVIVAKETYRKYPATKLLFNDRIYFADLLYKLGLSREALSEYNDISKIELNEKDKSIISKKIEEASLAVANEK